VKVILVLVIAALLSVGCGSAAVPGPVVAHTLGQVGLNCNVNMPGELGRGESLSITAHNTRPAVRVFLQSVQVGGYEGVSGTQAGPDTVTMDRWIALGPGQSKTYGPFPLSDPALENVGAVGGICLDGGTVTGEP
jgi:hypothetical protein